MDGTFIVTGAGSGLGRATIEHLNFKGFSVAGLDIGGPDGPVGVPLHRCDVADPDMVEATVARIAAENGPIVGLVTCAGIAPSAKLVGRKGQHDRGLFQRVLDVNVYGTLNVMASVTDRMKDNTPDVLGQRGVIVTTASIAAFEGQIGQIAYAASKGAVAAMTLPAARELARDGIRVMCIAPGVFDTPMMQAMLEEVRASIAATIPFPPVLGDPNDFADLVAHIIENKTLNGSVIRLDGALRMAGS